MGRYYLFCQYYRTHPSFTEEEIYRDFKKRELDELRKLYIQANCYDVSEMYECDWWNMYQTDNIIKQHLLESSLNKMPLRDERLLENIKSGNLFGYVQCDIEVPEKLREAFVNFPPIFKKTHFGSEDTGPFVKEYAGKKRIFDSANIKLFLGEWNNHYTVASLLSGLVAGLKEVLMLCAMHSSEVLQQLCSVCSEC